MSNRGTEVGNLLPVKTWMKNASIKAVLNALAAGGKEARFIGGCVRDELLKLPVNEVDLATPERPERVIELLEKAEIKAVPTGIKYGTVTAVIRNNTYQITSLRKDITTNGRHPVVEFTDDWREDAMRRDFTFNALSATPDGVVYDYLNGLQDLADRRIKFVGLAEERINEDHLRILRYFRFMATTGFLNDDKVSHQICIDNAYLLSHLSGERIREEFFKILISENYNDVLEVMVKSGVTRHFLPEAMQTNLTKHLIRVENFVNEHFSIIIDPVRRLASLISTDRSNVDAIAQRLKFSNDQYKKLKGYLVPEWQATWNIDDVSLRAGLYRFGAAYIINLSLQQWSRMLANTDPLPQEQNDAWLRIINTANSWKDRTFPIKGQDVVNLGIAEGPKISDILKKLENWWLNSGCTANRETCLKKLRQVSLDE